MKTEIPDLGNVKYLPVQWPGEEGETLKMLEGRFEDLKTAFFELSCEIDRIDSLIEDWRASKQRAAIKRVCAAACAPKPQSKKVARREATKKTAIKKKNKRT
jgi:hypothetical protein